MRPPLSAVFYEFQLIVQASIDRPTKCQLISKSLAPTRHPALQMYADIQAQAVQYQQACLGAAAAPGTE